MEFRVLGPLELWADGQRVEVSGSRQPDVLAMLLLERGRPVGQDRLIDAVWGDVPRSSVVATLHSCVYRLRRALGACDGVALRRDPSGYVLEVPVDSVDLHRFERLVAAGRRALDRADHARAADRLREALALWRGGAFAGIETPAVREYAAGLDDARLDATEWWATAELALGRHQSLLGTLETLTGEHPYRERLWELLMIAQYRSGRQADALEAYQRLYRFLDDELGVRPGGPVREVQQKILAGAPELDPPPAPSTLPPLVIPRLLPLGLRDFTGRAEQLKMLDTLLLALDDDEAATSVVSTVSGTAGVGKTALALHWAHRVADRFPDGQLYIDLRGFGPTGKGLPTGEAIRRFLDALGVPAERIPAGLEAQAGLYRSLLAGKRMLVLLDNASDEEQVRPLLPASPGCLSLVTSRNRLPGLVAAEAARPVDLDLLTGAEARELLARRLGHDRLDAEPDAAQDLIGLCARLPLALAVVAARAAMNPGFSLEAIAAQLRDTENGLDAFSGSDSATDLRVVFSWSIDQLTPDAARLFRTLGLDPGTDIGVPATASLAALPVDRARALLSELCRAHLISEHVPGRYLFHDLLCAYAYELATTSETPAVRQATIRRGLDHYLHSAYAAAMLFDPRRRPFDLAGMEPGTVPERFTDADRAKAWLHTERFSLLETIDRAYEEGHLAHAWQLAWSVADFLDRTGHWQDELNVLETQLEAGRRLGRPDVQTMAHRSIARVYNWFERFDDAGAHLQQAVALSRELDDPFNEAYLLEALALLASRQGRHDEAFAHTRRAVDLFRAGGYRIEAANALNSLGWHSAQRGDYRSGLEYCEQALALQRELGDRNSQSETLDSLGYIHHHLGDHQKAADCFQQAIVLFRQWGNRYLEADSLVHLGDTRHAAGDRAGARESWREALEVLEDLGHPDAEHVRAKLSG